MSFGIPVRNGLSIGLLASTFLTSGSGRLVPRLTLNFLTGGPLDPRITFSRTTNATLVDATGRVTYAPNNLVTYSEQFDNAGWTKDTATVTANATVAPDGTTTADKAIPNNGADLTSIANGAVRQAVTFPAGATLVFSVFAKEAEFDRIELYFSEGTGTANRATVTYSLVDGSVVTTAVVAGTFTNVSSTSTSVGNGWYRLTLTFTSGTATSARARFAVRDSGTTTGDGTSGIFIWGAQLEQVTYQTLPSTYVQTVASAYYGPRFDYNPVTLAPRGLLIEEQRVNLALYSEQFDNAAWVKTTANVTANVTTSPDGTTNADRLAGDGIPSSHTIQQTVTYTAAAHTFTAYAKRDTNNFVQLRFGAAAIAGGTGFANFDLNAGTVGTIGAGLSAASITPAGNGWYRCTITGTTAAASAGLGFYVVTSATAVSAEINTLTTSVFLYGAQLELGSFATSYIPTVASTVTRAADSVAITGANFSSWYNQSEGTIVFSGDSVRPAVTSPGTRLFQFDNATTANVIRTQGQSTLTVFDASVLQAIIASTPLILYDGTVFKFASAYKLDDFATVTTGAVATDTSGTVPTVTQLTLGNGAGGAFINGHIRTFTFYPSRLTNAQLQALTS
jgi:hypothetical protein